MAKNMREITEQEYLRDFSFEPPAPDTPSKGENALKTALDINTLILFLLIGCSNQSSTFFQKKKLALTSLGAQLTCVLGLNRCTEKVAERLSLSWQSHWRGSWKQILLNGSI